MACDVTSLPFKAHAKYGTWSIDFDFHNLMLSKVIKTSKNTYMCIQRCEQWGRTPPPPLYFNNIEYKSLITPLYAFLALEYKYFV